MLHSGVYMYQYMYQIIRLSLYIISRITVCKESHVWQPRVNVFQDSIGGTWPFLSRKQKHTTKKEMHDLGYWLVKSYFFPKRFCTRENIIFTLMSWIARNQCTLNFDVTKCFLLYINYLIVALAELKKCWRISAIVSYVHLKNFRCLPLTCSHMSGVIAQFVTGITGVIWSR